MVDEIDSKSWTGDYSTSGHYPIATEAQRRLQRRVIKYAFSGIAVLIAALSIWQVVA
jgi:hypothetical protein